MTALGPRGHPPCWHYCRTFRLVKFPEVSMSTYRPA
jgi:hypothetical protein